MMLREASHVELAVPLLLAIVALLAAFESFKLAVKSSLRKPFSFLWRRIDAWRFLFSGPEIIQEAYEKAQGRPFEVLSPDTRCVFFSSPQHIKEIDAASKDVLSLQAASKQFLQPKYTMHGFDWFDKRGAEGIGFVRALRTLLTNHLPELLPGLRRRFLEGFSEALASHKVAEGVRYSPVFPLILHQTALANARSFFGEDVARDTHFLHHAVRHVEETAKVAEIIRLIPSCLQPLVGWVLRRFMSSQGVLYQGLLSETEKRIKMRELQIQGHEVPQHHDCIQWIMDTAPKQALWSAQRIVYELIAIWFGSVHAMSITATFALYDLCLHPEYLEPLRKELESEEHANFERDAQGLPLLDSFLKESARLTPLESLSTRRQATRPFTFHDGTRLKVGDWACTPVRAKMQDRQFYPEPLKFNGFRFVDSQLLDKYAPSFGALSQPEGPSRLTDASDSWHMWGSGRIICPGRFYAAAVMKIMLAQIILKYDPELTDKSAKRWWTWRSSILPKETTTVNFVPRR